MHIRFALLGLLAYQTQVLAADVATMASPTGSILKMVMGLAVVLAVMALISWGVKRMLPNGSNQQSVVKVVGGVSVGSRERVVVVEVAGRWLVVGVAQGQVNSLANLEVGSDQLASDVAQTQTGSPNHMTAAMATKTIAKPFSEWLSTYAKNISTKRNQQKI